MAEFPKSISIDVEPTICGAEWTVYGGNGNG